MKLNMVFLLLSCFSVNSIAQWTNLLDSTNLTFNVLSSGTANHAFAISYDNKLYETTNAGADWQEVLLNLPVAQGELLDILDVDGDNAYLLNRNNPNSQTAFIFKTTDGGQSWIDVSPPNFPLGYGIAEMDFEDVNNGYAAIEGMIAKTTDGGQTWTTKQLSQYYGVQDIDFHDTNHGIAGAWDGTFLYAGGIYFTNDGGATWDSLVFTTANSVIGKVAYADANTAYALSDAWNTTQRLYRTRDNGMTWDTLQLTFLSDSSDSALDIYFMNADEGYLATGYGRIYQTTDGGDTWILDHNGGPSSLSRLESNGLTVYALGSPNILLANQLFTGTNPVEMEQNSFEIYPNPLTEGNRLHFTSPQTGVCTIYSMNGKEVMSKTIDKEWFIDVGNLSTGVYLVTIGNKVQKICIN